MARPIPETPRNKKQTPNKHQTLKHLKTNWCFEVLELVVSLDLVSWCLVFKEAE
jgi:hypothetical protein